MVSSACVYLTRSSAMHSTKKEPVLSNSHQKPSCSQHLIITRTDRQQSLSHFPHFCFPLPGPQLRNMHPQKTEFT